jgi:hypothetical protein
MSNLLGLFTKELIYKSENLSYKSEIKLSSNM